MPPTNDTPLFKKSTSRSDIVRKALRHFLERNINRLARSHSARRRQLAVFSFDYLTTQIILDGLYEVDELEIFIQWLQNFDDAEIFNGVALDVGANIGNHSLFFSDYYSAVRAFEPHPLTYKLLSINSELVSNVKCFNFGISSAERSASIVVDNRNMSGAHVVSGSTAMAVPIELKTLDSVMASTDGLPVRLIKIDVEGHECEALRGAEATIRGSQPIIIFEQHASDFVGGSTQTIDLIRSYGYENFACIERTPAPPSFLPDPLQRIFSVVARLVVGSSRQIVMMKVFEPRFYPFIVAIPVWLDLQIDARLNRS